MMDSLIEYGKENKRNVFPIFQLKHPELPICLLNIRNSEAKFIEKANITLTYWVDGLIGENAILKLRSPPDVLSNWYKIFDGKLRRNNCLDYDEVQLYMYVYEKSKCYYAVLDINEDYHEEEVEKDDNHIEYVIEQLRQFQIKTGLKVVSLRKFLSNLHFRDPVDGDDSLNNLKLEIPEEHLHPADLATVGNFTIKEEAELPTCEMPKED